MAGPDQIRIYFKNKTCFHVGCEPSEEAAKNTTIRVLIINWRAGEILTGKDLLLRCFKIIGVIYGDRAAVPKQKTFPTGYVWSLCF